MARRLGDPATLAEVLLLRQAAAMGPDTVRERLDLTGEILVLADQLEDLMLASRALILRVRAARETGDFIEADRALERAERLIEELGQPTLRWLTTANRLSGLAFAGELDRAEMLLTVADSMADASGQPDSWLWLTWERFQVRFEQGRLDDVDDLVLDATERSPQPYMYAMLARCHCELGRLDEALPIFDGLAADRFSLPVDNTWLRGITDCAAVCASLGDSIAAVRLRELLTPYADQVVTMAPAISGSVSHYLGLLAAVLGDFAEAEERFAVAAETHDRIGARPWLVRTHMDGPASFFEGASRATSSGPGTSSATRWLPPGNSVWPASSGAP